MRKSNVMEAAEQFGNYIIYDVCIAIIPDKVKLSVYR